MRRMARRLGLGVVGLVLALALAMALGVAVPRGVGGGDGVGDGPGDGPGGDTVLVIAGPIHTDLALPVDARTRALFGFVEGAGVPLGDPGARWLLLGWGGRSFYLETPRWEDLRPGPVLRSLGLDRSVLRVDVVGDIPEGVPGVTRLRLPPGGRERLEALALATFSRGAEGAPVAVAPGFGATDAFFAAEGRFNLLLGCNTWTAAALRAAGVRTGWWTPLPQGLVASVRWHDPGAVE